DVCQHLSVKIRGLVKRRIGIRQRDGLVRGNRNARPRRRDSAENPQRNNKEATAHAAYPHLGANGNSTMPGHFRSDSSPLLQSDVMRPSKSIWNGRFISGTTV